MSEEIKTLPHHHHDNDDLLFDYLPEDSTIQTVADAMKLLGDSSRLKIFWILCHCEECVINIAALTDMTSPAVSHHLRLLKQSGLITSRREGKEMYYTAAETELVSFLHKTIEAIGHLSCPHDNHKD